MQLLATKTHLIKDKFLKDYIEPIEVLKEKANESEDEECIILEDNQPDDEEF
jgi:hypothetical protein